MATTETVRAELATRADNGVEQAKPLTVKQLVETMKGQFARALPTQIPAERFTRLALTALSANPKLERCTSQSLLGALMTCAQLGLEPNTPLQEAFLIPYGDVCTFVPGYQGLAKLAWQSGQVSEMYAEPVYENDHFVYTLGLHRDLVHEPAKGERGPLAGVYAVVKLASGGVQFDYMTAAELAAHRKRYVKEPSRGESPWDTSDWMQRKTVLKQVLKLIPKSTAMSQALAQDGAVRTDIAPEALDNVIEGELIDGEAS